MPSITHEKPDLRMSEYSTKTVSIVNLSRTELLKTMVKARYAVGSILKIRT